MNVYSDEEILVRLRKEGQPAMKILYDKYYNYLCHAVYNVLKDSVMAEDIVQDVFMEIWKKREQIDINTSLKAYLRRAAVNKSLNHIRNTKIRLEGDDDLKGLKLNEEDVQAKMEVDELQLAVHEAIDGLPPKCKEVFQLSRFESKSYQEIADLMNISVKTVENQISKALKVLRVAVQEHKKK